MNIHDFVCIVSNEKSVDENGDENGLRLGTSYSLSVLVIRSFITLPPCNPVTLPLTSFRIRLVIGMGVGRAIGMPVCRPVRIRLVIGMGAGLVIGMPDCDPA